MRIFNAMTKFPVQKAKSFNVTGGLFLLILQIVQILSILSME